MNIDKWTQSPEVFYWIAGFLALCLGLYIAYRFILRSKSLYEFNFKNLEAHRFEYQHQTSLNFDIRYQLIGEGPVVLFLHGIGASSFTWRFLVPLLKRNFKLLIIDLPGFGGSSRKPGAGYNLDQQTQRIEKFLDQLNVYQCRVVGSSMGGTLALYLARKSPDRFIEVACLSPATSRKLLKLPVRQWRHFAKVLSWGIHDNLKKQILKKVIRRHELIDNQMIDQYWTIYEKDPNAIKTFFEATDFLKNPEIENLNIHPKVRVMVLWGEKDEITPFKYFNELKNSFPSAEYFSHPNAGHHIMEDDPIWVANSLKNFFGNQDF